MACLHPPTSAAGSELSIFRHLANPRKVDVERVTMDREKKPKHGRGFRGAVEYASQSNPQPPARAKPSVFFSTASQVVRKMHQNEKVDPKPPESTFAHASEKSRYTPVQMPPVQVQVPAATFSPPVHAEVLRPADSASQIQFKLHSVPEVPSAHDPTGYSHADWERERHSVANNIEDEIGREKQGYLIELQKYKRQGIEISREFTMRDSLEDIQFECDRVRANEKTINAVRLMSFVLEMIVRGVSMVNTKWPILKLDDGYKSWSTEQVEKIKGKEYDHVLERLYKKHWRKGSSMSPEMEIGMMLGGSLGMYHFRTKVEGVRRPEESDNTEGSNAPFVRPSGMGLPFGMLSGILGGGGGGGLGGMFGGGNSASTHEASVTQTATATSESGQPLMQAPQDLGRSRFNFSSPSSDTTPAPAPAPSEAPVSCTFARDEVPQRSSINWEISDCPTGTETPTDPLPELPLKHSSQHSGGPSVRPADTNSSERERDRSQRAQISNQLEQLRHMQHQLHAAAAHNRRLQAENADTRDKFQRLKRQRERTEQHSQHLKQNEHVSKPLSPVQEDSTESLVKEITDILPQGKRRGRRGQDDIVVEKVRSSEESARGADTEEGGKSAEGSQVQDIVELTEIVEIVGKDESEADTLEKSKGAPDSFSFAM